MRSSTITFEKLRRQECTLITANLVVMAIVLGVLGFFSGELGRVPTTVILLIAARMVEQGLELLWLCRRKETLASRFLNPYAYGTIVAHLAFAATVSIVAQFDHSHFVVLFFLPIISGAFRLSALQLTILVLTTCALTFIEVYLEASRGSTVAALEYYENTVVCLSYAMVAIIVRQLARQLESREAALEQSLSELSEAQGKLVEEERLSAVGRLAASLAHEIRNPVTLISSRLAIADDKDLDSIRSGVKPEIDRLERLTTDFLTYARGKEPDLEEASIQTSLNYVAGLCGPKAAEGGVKVVVHCEPELRGRFDQHMLHQALLNLGLNAIQASKPGAEVRFEALLDENNLTIRVVNAGAAIPNESVVKLFEPFFSTKKHGSGLGLAVSRSIATAHKGSLVLEENVSGRVCFMLSLPQRPIVEAQPRS